MSKAKMAKKDMRTYWHVVILTGILSSIPLLLLIAWYLLPKSLLNSPISQNSVTTVNNSNETSGTPSATLFDATSKTANLDACRKEAKIYYPTFEQAIDAFRPSDAVDFHRVSGEILGFENDDAATAYYWCVNGGNELGICSVFSVKKESEYSNLLDSKFTFIVSNPQQDFSLIKYRFTPEETAALYLTDQFSSVSTQSIPNNGVPVYIGISDSSAIKNLRVLGRPPSQIIKSKTQGKTYYIWIYKGLDIETYLLKTKDFTFGNFTYNQLISILQIHFASSSDPVLKETPITTVN